MNWDSFIPGRQRLPAEVMHHNDWHRFEDHLSQLLNNFNHSVNSSTLRASLRDFCKSQQLLNNETESRALKHPGCTGSVPLRGYFDCFSNDVGQMLLLPEDPFHQLAGSRLRRISNPVLRKFSARARDVSDLHFFNFVLIQHHGFEEEIEESEAYQKLLRIKWKGFVLLNSCHETSDSKAQFSSFLSGDLQNAQATKLIEKNSEVALIAPLFILPAWIIPKLNEVLIEELFYNEGLPYLEFATNFLHRLHLELTPTNQEEYMRTMTEIKALKKGAPVYLCDFLLPLYFRFYGNLKGSLGTVTEQLKDGDIRILEDFNSANRRNKQGQGKLYYPPGGVDEETFALACSRFESTELPKVVQTTLTKEGKDSDIVKIVVVLSAYEGQIKPDQFQKDLAHLISSYSLKRYSGKNVNIHYRIHFDPVRFSETDYKIWADRWLGFLNELNVGEKPGETVYYLEQCRDKGLGSQNLKHSVLAQTIDSQDFERFLSQIQYSKSEFPSLEIADLLTVYINRETGINFNALDKKSVQSYFKQTRPQIWESIFDQFAQKK